MKNVILGTVAGLVLGTAGALAYSHYLGDGKLLADLQAQLDTANASLAKLSQEKKQLSKETTGVSDQVDQLVQSNEDLKKQLDDLKKTPETATAPTAVNPATLVGMMRGMMRGGVQGQQRMFLLQSRLNLTPDQAAKIKAAMDADSQQRRELGRQLFQGGKVDPAAAANANTLDQTLATVLTPDQQTSYKQVQADEQASRADSSATVQMNQIAPLLQLSDSQKDQVVQALYQVQMSAPDPTSLMTNPNAASIVTSQAQATQDALAKVLTPQQMALYQQQGQMFSNTGFGGGGRGGRGGNAAATAAPASAPTPAQ